MDVSNGEAELQRSVTELDYTTRVSALCWPEGLGPKKKNSFSFFFLKKQGVSQTVVTSSVCVGGKGGG